jgi:hypothetical protein
LLSTQHSELMPQNEQFDVLSERATTAPTNNRSSAENAR